MSHNNFCYLEELTEDRLASVLDQWRRQAPGGSLLALLAEREQAQVPLLQAGCRERELALVGALFPGLVYQQRFVDKGALLLFLPWAPPQVLIEDLDPSCASAAAAIAAAFADHVESGPPPTLFTIFDAMVPKVASILDELYLELADAVTYLGANAGSETFQPMPCLFDSERLVGNGVLCMLLPGGWSSAIIHGYRAPEDTLTATATLGNKIVSIDWRPAFEVYCEKVLEIYGVALDRENFYRYAVHFPFGLDLANGETLVRIPVALDEDGGILCVGEVPGNSLLTLLQSPAVDSVDTARSLAKAFSDQDPCPWRLFFYCAGRRMHLGEGAERELGICERELGAELVGALSLGEIGALGTTAYPLFHNAALVSLEWRPEDAGY